MMKKRRFIEALAISTIILGMQSVEAVSYTIGYASTGDNTQSTPREDIEVGLGTRNGITYTCKYNYRISSSKIVTIDGYDIQDNEIMQNSLNISDKNRILAGTSIGLNIYETKTVGWELTKVEVTETKVKKTDIYICTYKTKITPLPRPKPGSQFEITLVPMSDTSTSKVQTISTTCQETEKTTTSPTTCPSPANNCILKSGPEPSYYKADGETTKKSTNETKIEECRAIAASTAIAAANGSTYASYEIEMSDSNDINGTNGIKITNEDANKTRECENGTCSFSYSAGMTNDSKMIRFYYKKARACINVKTAEVTYKTGDDTCDQTLEKEISNTTIGSNTHWHYFIPLNAKSTDTVEINMLKASGGQLTTEECLYVMQHNPINASNQNSNATTYVNLIKPIANGEEFDGDYKCYDCNPKNPEKWNSQQSADYKEVQANGCYLTSKIKIPVNQKFYNEVTTADGKNALKGFNFYYKPIDINEPFPNGVLENSLWNNWNKSTTKNPDLSKSFETKTYEVIDINSNEVREYNENNPYTSWKNMNLDGTSKYIDDNQKMIKRSEDISVYKLGCGPANSKEYLDEAKKIKNPLFIKGCGNKS